MPSTNPITSLEADWQSQLRDVISSRGELLALMGLDEAALAGDGNASDQFALKVPRSFAARMRHGDARDPLLLQVLSSAQETIAVPGYTPDPLQENGDAMPRRGLIHKYRGRVLLVLTGSCAVNCRYCFRRHFPYGENRNSREQWLSSMDYIRANNEIEEVILSGGDPLLVNDRQLAKFLEQVAAIDHVKRLRIHTRMPIVIPQRITDELLSILAGTRLQTVMVVHCNHANEIDECVGAALRSVSARGITLLNQAVLLRAINDSVAAQVALNEALFAASTLPYYLHMLDPVQGAAHFDVPEPEALELMRKIRNRLPGYLVPKLVREVAGEGAKLPVQHLHQ